MNKLNILTNETNNTLHPARFKTGLNRNTEIVFNIQTENETKTKISRQNSLKVKCIK